MRGNNFITGYAYLLYYKCHKINPNHGGSCMDSTDWIKNKKETINLSNLQYTITVTWNHEEIGKHSERITKLGFVYLLSVILTGKNKFSIRKRWLEKNWEN